MSASLILFVPGLLQRFSERSQPQAPPLPTLERLLARADRQVSPSRDKDHTLAALFGAPLNDPLPRAALSWAGDSGDTSSGYYLRADPVHLHPDRDRLLLFDARHLAIHQHEADALVASLTEHFASLDIALHAPRRERWYLQLRTHPALITTTLDEATGRDVLRHLPSGEDGPHWRTLLNEVQMVLHHHPVNQQREERGEPGINSLWFWGNGEQPPPFAARFSRVLSNDPVALGLAGLSNTDVSIPTENAGQWLEQIDSDAKTGTEQLLHWDQLHQAQTLGDSVAWSDALLRFERDWLAPLCEALTNRRIASLSLLGGDDHEYRLTRGKLKRWWRRNKPYSGYLIQQQVL